MAVAPLDADPARAFAELARIAGAAPGRPPGRDRDLGRDERRSGGRDRCRRDTPACRVRGPRSAAIQRVASEPGSDGATPAHRDDQHESDRKAWVRWPARCARWPCTSVSSRTRTAYGEYGEYGEYEDGEYDETAPTMGGQPTVARRASARPASASVVPAGPRRGVERVATVRELDRITTLHPRTYNEARTIGEHFREGTPVIMNLTEMDDNDAKRLVDFAAGLIFGLRGSIERVTQKVFLLSPQNVTVTAEDKARIAEGGFFNQS